MMKLQSINPTTGEVIATYAEHSPAEVERRIQLAHDGWKAWSQTPMAERSAFLLRMAELIEAQAEDYARLIVSEMGKPIGEAIGEVKKCALGARHFAEQGPGYIADEAIPGTPARVVYQSIGPVFAIMPWNLPFWQVLRLFSPTALVGNTLIVKHAESVQGCAEAIEQLVRDAGGPEGLYVNLAIQREEAARVIADPRVAAVTVTGSVRAGRAVAEQAGSLGKKVVLELGGSDPFLVFEDADIAKAVQLGVQSRFSNNAQSCIAAKRFFVARSVAQKFTDAYVAAVRDTLTVGDARDGAVKAGAKVLTGGHAMQRAGNFYEPTVLIDLPHDAAVAREEFFGPVATIYVFDSEDEAIGLANDTEYGLGATVISGNPERAQRVAGAIQSGVVFINDFLRSDPRVPFGGTKASGFGRELGGMGARELANAKVIWGS